jgi:hypothetical protein
MVNEINNQNAQNVNNLMTYVYKNKPAENETASVNQSGMAEDKNKPSINNMQETAANSQGNATVGKTVDILA